MRKLKNPDTADVLFQRAKHGIIYVEKHRAVKDLHYYEREKLSMPCLGVRTTLV